MTTEWTQRIFVIRFLFLVSGIAWLKLQHVIQIAEVFEKDITAVFHITQGFELGIENVFPEQCQTWLIFGPSV